MSDSQQHAQQNGSTPHNHHVKPMVNGHPSNGNHMVNGSNKANGMMGVIGTTEMTSYMHHGPRMHGHIVHSAPDRSAPDRSVNAELMRTRSIHELPHHDV